MTKEESKEWSDLCLQVANDVAPKLEEFIPTPFESAEKQRGRFIIELAKELELREYRKKIDRGMEVINEHLITLPESSQKSILDMIATYLSCMSDPAKVQHIPEEKKQEGIDLATVFDLDLNALKQIESIGMQCVNEEKWDDGAGVFSLLTHWQQLSADHWFHEALCCYFAKRLDESLNSIEVAILLRGNQPEFYVLQAALAELLGNTDLSKNACHSCDEAIAKYSLTLPPEWQRWRDSLKFAVK